jgi:hypothetical protein
MSSGTRIITYTGTGDTTYAKSITLPQAKGTYAVTFNMAAVAGWDAATDLVAGTLTVDNPTPVAEAYTFANWVQFTNVVTAIAITPKANKSSGARTIYYTGIERTTYPRSDAIPNDARRYSVTFDVAAVDG